MYNNTVNLPVYGGAFARNEIGAGAGFHDEGKDRRNG